MKGVTAIVGSGVLLVASGSIFCKISALRDAVKPIERSSEGITDVGFGKVLALETDSGPPNGADRVGLGLWFEELIGWWCI